MVECTLYNWLLQPELVQRIVLPLVTKTEFLVYLQHKNWINEQNIKRHKLGIHLYKYTTTIHMTEVYLWRSFNKQGWFFEKSKINLFFPELFHKYFSIGLLQKLFQSHKNISSATIQNDNKSNRMLQAWTEVCYQIFAGWEVQTMWNSRRMCDVYGEMCFSKKMFTNGLNMS